MRQFANFHADAWLRQRVGELGLALGLGLAFAYIGPFSTDQSDFLPKLGYWAGLLACWFVVAALVEQGLRTFVAYRNAGIWAKRVWLVGVGSFPMLLVTAPATTALNGFEATVPEVTEMYLQIMLVALVVVVLADAILGPSGAPEAPNSAGPFARTDFEMFAPAPISAEPESIGGVRLGESAGPPFSRLMQRLPLDLRGPVICLEMEDHYVRVHTTRGSTLLLMRLGDAMREAAPTAGLQSHRSWWVAVDAVEAFERAGRAGRVRLKNGLSAPVSQPYVRTIRELAGKQ